MDKKKEFNNILDQCLERMLVGGETIEQCLSNYPEQAAELEPLLRVALATKEASATRPHPEFRERARYQFQAALRETAEKRERHFSLFRLQPHWATALIIALVFLLAGSGTVAAASNSMPDEPLYQVKLATETVRLALTPSSLGKVELYAHLADKRVDEIITMADKGKPEEIEQTAQRLNGHLIAMANLAAPQEANTLMAPAPQAATTEALPGEDSGTLMTPEPPPSTGEEIPPDEPEEIPTPNVKVPPLSRQQKGQGAPEMAADGNGAGGNNEDTKSNKRAQLRATIAQQAADRSEALHEALKNAPEAVKPALRQALDIADSGYQQALNSLD